VCDVPPRYDATTKMAPSRKTHPGVSEQELRLPLKFWDDYLTNASLRTSHRMMKI
jgi:hypothetical protein